MNDYELEKKLTQLMGQDFSAGTEAFRDTLLSRCLAELGADDKGVEVDDDDLDMLAAAGVAGMPGDSDMLGMIKIAKKTP